MMIMTELPPRSEMIDAFMRSDPAYDGIFVTAVQTTGIFCRPTCPARKPRPENVYFFPCARDALLAGYRACKKCRPMEPADAPPEWLRVLLEEVEADPVRRWTDEDLRRLDLHPDRVRRWFQKVHGMSFHAYSRARRLGLAMGQIRIGSDVSSVAFDHGYDSLSGFGEAFKQLFGAAPVGSAAATIVTINRYLSPLGPMVLGATEQAVCLVEFAERRMLATQLDRLRRRLGCVMVPGTTKLLERAAAELDAYFDGASRDFSMPLLTPGTDLQQAVWKQLMSIPYGATISYGELAREVGRPTAVRAVARSVGDNRISIVIPCHRVVGHDGRLTGYGGGLWRKKRLLEHEEGQGD
jgi:AraC family transcriptional regulator of adaptative response/methylated-DNA-[protein]-cysteine methyltransferase